MDSLSVIKAKIVSTLKREEPIAPDKTLNLLYSEGVPITGTPVKVVLAKGEGTCNHIIITATDQINMKSSTHRYHLTELKAAMDNSNLDEAWDSLFAQIKPIVVKNADQPLNVIKAAVEAWTYII